MTRLRFTMAMIGVVLLTGCESGVTEPVVMGIEIVTGDNQVAPAGSTLIAPLTVRVTDSRGTPAAGVVVNWRVEDRGALTSTVSRSVTGTTGIASIWRTLGGLAGTYRTSASLKGHAGAEVMFTSIAQIQGATLISRLTEPHPVDTVLATLAPFAVLVRDHNDAPVSGVVVTWSATDGSLSSFTSVTDASGIAEATYTLGSTATSDLHVNIVNASVSGLIGSPVFFQAISTPGNPTGIIAIAGDQQFGVVQQETIAPYVAGVTDAYGNLVEGVNVDWRVEAGGGSVDPPGSVTITSDGSSRPVATAVHTLGSVEGVQSVSATATDVPGSPQVTFSATAVTASVSVLARDLFDYDCWYYGVCAPIFDPHEVEIPAGRTVIWVWHGHACDLVFEDDPTQPTSSALRRTGVHTRTFVQPGIYRFRCTRYSESFTEGMVGQVTVH
jgi:hypothetical protein